MNHDRANEVSERSKKKITAEKQVLFLLGMTIVVSKRSDA